MAVSVVGVASGNTGSGTRNLLATSLPFGWAHGDIAVLVGDLSGTALTMTTPAGWALLAGVAWPVTEAGGSRMYAWSRALQAGDTAPSISVSGAMTGGWTMIGLRGAQQVSQAAAAAASGASVTLPTLSGVRVGSALLYAAHCRVPAGTAPPSNLTPSAAYTELADHATSRPSSSANLRVSAGCRLVTVGGSAGGEPVGSDVAGSMVGLLVEIASLPVRGEMSPAYRAAPAAATSGRSAARASFHPRSTYSMSGA